MRCEPCLDCHSGDPAGAGAVIITLQWAHGLWCGLTVLCCVVRISHNKKLQHQLRCVSYPESKASLLNSVVRSPVLALRVSGPYVLLVKFLE